jgi:alcohol dehydrogenase, propanol-preferring
MKAMVLNQLCDLGKNPNSLVLADLPVPEPQADEILARISACGLCHTELDEIEGRTLPSHFPIILEHQIVGQVDKTGSKALRELQERKILGAKVLRIEGP